MKRYDICYDMMEESDEGEYVRFKDLSPASTCSAFDFEKWLKSERDRYDRLLNESRPHYEDYFSYRSMRWAFAFVLERLQNQNGGN